MQAVQPLPVLAFAFLEEEKSNSNYAVEAEIMPIPEQELHEIHKHIKTRLNARCKDLLEVRDDDSECSFFRSKVEFLHRTVREFFLETDAIDTLLKRRTVGKFDARISICRIMLALIKALPMYNGFEAELNHLFSLVDEFMHYAHDIEIEYSKDPNETRKRCVDIGIELLDKLDLVCTVHAKDSKVHQTHWTNARDIPRGRYQEYKQKTFLASAIQARLTLYVKYKLDKCPELLREKRGRPYLDYALRPKMVTPIELADQDASPDADMVRLLLERGANPNQKIYIYDQSSAWELFLKEMYYNADKSFPLDRNEWYELVRELVRMLILKGADPDVAIQPEEPTGKKVRMQDVLRQVFTQFEVTDLEELINDNRQRSFNMSRWLRLLRLA